MSTPLLQEHPPPPPPITPLPPPTQSLLRSTTILPSLPSILSELTQNSIDAHSTRINCTVDLDTWTVKVEDNGEGFTREGIAQLASSKGGRYCTSKLSGGDVTGGTSADSLLSGVETYGFRGEALASIVDVATLEIRSTSAQTGETSEVVLRGGEVVRLVTTAGRGGGGGGGKGTTVWARDIFYKLPVRRRPLLKPSAHPTLLTQLRSTLSTLSLVHPNIAFSLTDTTSSSLSGAGNGEAKVLLQLNRANEGVVGRWKQIWGRVGVEKVWEFDESEGENVGEGEAEEGSTQTGGAARARAKGFFSLSAAHSTAGQYIFVNSRPLSPTSSPLHKLLNSLIAASSFARHASSHLSYSPSPSKPSPSPAPAPALTPAKTTRQSPKKAAERHPVFVLCLEVPGGWVDVSLEPEKRVVEFSDPARNESFLSSLTKKFLVENGFATAPPAPPPPSRPPATTAEETPKKRPRVEAATSTAGRKRVAFSLEEDGTPRPSSRPVTRSTSTSRLPTRGVDPPTADPFSPSLSFSPFPSAAAAAADANSTTTSTRYARWTDPSTLHTYLIDQRTGNSWREGTRPDLEEQGHGECEGCGGGRKRKMTERSGGGMVERGWLKRRRDEGEGEQEDGEMPEWLRWTLEDWHNPIFPSIPSSSIGAAKIPSLPSLPINPLGGTSAAPTLSSAFSSSKAGLSRATGKKSSSFSSAAAPALTHTRLKTMTDFFSTSSYPVSSPHPVQAEPTSLLPLSASSSSGSHRLTRSALAKAEFVAQVDDKFLLIRVPSPSSSPSTRGGGTLVLVDQHAASERVRVERFWAALTRSSSEGGVERKELKGEEERVGVVVGREEARVVKETEAEGEWGRWGVGFEDFELPEGEAGAGEGGGDYVQLFLSSVPALLAARLTSEPRTAQELVRSFVAQLRERGSGSGSGSRRGGGEGNGEDVGVNERGWVGQVKDAPPVLVELVNSKACRGAVMFNDVLPPSQSLSLLRALSSTKFPFQCAHGRPSMVPLVELPAPPSSRRGRAGGRGEGLVDWEKFA